LLSAPLSPSPTLRSGSKGTRMDGSCAYIGRHLGVGCLRMGRGQRNEGGCRTRDRVVHLIVEMEMSNCGYSGADERALHLQAPQVPSFKHHGYEAYLKCIHRCLQIQKLLYY